MHEEHEDESPTIEQEAARYEADVQSALQIVGRRRSYEQTTEDTPLTQLLASEEGQLDEWAVKNETALTLLGWLAADGPHPAQVLRRVYLLGNHLMVSPFCELTMREKAKLLNCSHGTVLWLMKRLCSDPLMRKGSAAKGAGQKGQAASAAASVAQRGNNNRRGGNRAVAENRQRKISRPNQQPRP